MIKKVRAYLSGTQTERSQDKSIARAVIRCHAIVQYVHEHGKTEEHKCTSETIGSSERAHRWPS